ncbi:MAG TPA: hypothetical protein VIK11_01885 [Tepidiformaceae bacterium]|jgi:hypothetical protein
MVATTVERDVPISSRHDVKHVITTLFAAGLELQGAMEKRGLSPRERAMISREFQLIAGMIDELRNPANASWERRA